MTQGDDLLHELDVLEYRAWVTKPDAERVADVQAMSPAEKMRLAKVGLTERDRLRRVATFGKAS